MTKYPSLFAALEPDTTPDGTRGATVRCTATRRALGFVWWEVVTGTTVAWFYRTGAEVGERTTERNAVQALRDLANGATRHPIAAGLPFDDSPTPTDADAPHITPTRATPAPPAAPARRVIWNTSAPAFDVTAAIAAGLKGKR